jgi:N-acetylmuramoyl-L-alanine amidase
MNQVESVMPKLLTIKLISIILILFAFICLPAHCNDSPSSSSLKIVHPQSGSYISEPSTYIVGQTDPAAILTCNGLPVKVNRAGFFAHVVPLQYGANHFVLAYTNKNDLQSSSSNYDAVSDTNTKNSTSLTSSVTAQEEFTVYRKAPVKPIGTNEIKLVEVSPSANLGLRTGDPINFTVHATPNSKVIVQFGEHELVLLPNKGKYISENSPEVTYGKVVQSSPSVYGSSDLYKGVYRVSESDHFINIHPRYTLVNSIKTVSVISKVKINTVERFLTARTNRKPTVVRIAPNLARTTPLVDDVRITVDGWSGDNMRCFYSPNRHVWIKNRDLSVDNGDATLPSRALSKQSEAMTPQVVARTINLVNDSYGEQLRLPLTDRLPYQIEQKLNPNCLILRVYGVSSDTDWITNEPETDQTDKQVIDHVTWKQPEDNVYEITVHLSGNRQWGYKISYENNTLCLDVKREALSTRAYNNGRLDGLKVCLDPGHGGSEPGSTGCSGLPETQLNLAIALKTKTCLEDLGATVIMTRTSDSETVSLDERVKIATDCQADFFISIHNNSLPDGRNPLQEHGTSSYWYQPQSLELARCLKNSVKKYTNFPDLGARYQNLAIARASSMPSVLLEIGFMINPDEFTQLIDPQFQSTIAQAIAAGVTDYLNHNQQQPEL